MRSLCPRELQQVHSSAPLVERKRERESEKEARRTHTRPHAQRERIAKVYTRKRKLKRMAYVTQQESKNESRAFVQTWRDVC